mgnify:CR=1 FL=1|tara:strand:- start:36 stop:731 length:696 start_codon:yes stop_codon:yes gene_type:complete
MGKYALVASTEEVGPLTHGDDLNIPISVMGITRKGDDGRRFIVDAGWPLKVPLTVDMEGLDEGSAALLHGIVKAIQPSVCLETGTHKGRSTQAILSALVGGQRGHLWTVDKEEFGVQVSGALSPTEIKRATFNIGETPHCLDQLLYSNDNICGISELIDFAYLDGGHEEMILLAEMVWVEKHGADNLVMVIDNTLDPGWPGVPKAIDKFLETQSWEVITLPTMTGFTLLRR